MNKPSTALFLSVLSLVAFSGCGPNLVSDGSSATSRESYSYGQAYDADYNCPGAENILPPDDRAMDGTQRYTACTSRSSTAKIRLEGISSSSRTLCAFPVQYLNENQFVYKLDQYSQPMYKCYDSQANAEHTAVLEFPSTNFNGVVVVDQALRVQMTSCLVAGNNCPMHAIGKFR